MGLAASALIIANGTLIDGTGARPRPNGAIVVRGDTIAEVSALPPSGSGYAAPVDAVVIDAKGKFILPGLIDGHVHLSMYQGAPPEIASPSSAEFCTLRAAQHLLPILRAGFTSVSVPGGKWYVDATLRDAVKAGMLRGPRIFCAGRALTPPGGIFDNRPEAVGDLPDDATGVLCRTAADFVAETRRQCERGVDMIKIADSRWGDEQTLPLAMIAAVVEEAHKHGAKVSIHSRGSGSTRDAARAGVDWIFHADLATEDDLEAVAAAGIPIMPAFAQGEIWAEHGSGVAPAMRERLKSQLAINIKAIATAKERGIKLLLGTDSGNAAVMTLGKWHGYEATFFVKHLGYTPLETITLQTRENAIAMGLEDKLGTIVPGKFADILVLDADPSEDVTVLGDPAHVCAVVKDGKPVDLASQP
ncbi:MAG TPA: amidohydrolase family protein [Stellaceae bacterium]|nr:amidohydrolase family protein [Stellaceae bacterium]